MADIKMTQLRKARVRALRVVAAYTSMRELSETEFRRLAWIYTEPESANAAPR
jgi:hypothetical protein